MRRLQYGVSNVSAKRSTYDDNENIDGGDQNNAAGWMGTSEEYERQVAHRAGMALGIYGLTNRQRFTKSPNSTADSAIKRFVKLVSSFNRGLQDVRTTRIGCSVGDERSSRAATQGGDKARLEMSVAAKPIFDEACNRVCGVASRTGFERSSPTA